jgi:hypothetical protein
LSFARPGLESGGEIKSDIGAGVAGWPLRQCIIPWRLSIRISIEELYPTKEAYVTAFRKAANDLVARRFLSADDAARLISEAERDGIRSAP